MRYNYIKEKYIRLLGGKCVVCSSKKCLEFDHIDPAKKEYDVTRKICSYSYYRIKKELDKCQLLCEKHHNIKTLKEKGMLSAIGTHGTLSSYRWCKCDKCRKAKAAYMKVYLKEYRLLKGR